MKNTKKRNMTPKYEHDRRPWNGRTAVSCGSIPSAALASAPNCTKLQLSANKARLQFLAPQIKNQKSQFNNLPPES
jgi:hypothetical protein